MMERLSKRGEEIASDAERKAIARIANALSEQLRNAPVEVGVGRIAISGRGLVRRWLADPTLRFLWNGLK